MQGVCPNGHGSFQEGDYCPRCGQELEKINPPANQEYKIIGDNPCPGCGYKLNHQHQAYCPGCGHQLKWLCR